MLKLERYGVAATVAVFSILAAGAATAAGTASNTQIDNQASVNYDVLGVTQAQIDSNTASFLVDNRVDLTVTEVGSAFTLVASGGTNQVLTFTVTNTGNTVQDFLLTAVDATTGTVSPFGGGETDNFDATNPFAPGEGVFVDDGDGNYIAANDTETFIDELAPDANVTVFIVRNIGTQADDDLALLSLNAQVAQGGAATTEGAAITSDDSGTADDPNAVEIVFSDGAGTVDVALDGQHSAMDGYIVGSANLSVAKSSTVIDDFFTTSGNPKAIPGAIMEYTVSISNAAGAAASATNITVTDSLVAEIAAARLAFEADGYAVGFGIQVTAPNINGGAALDLSNAADADQGDFTADVVTVSGIDLAPGESATVTFRVEIQ